MLSLFFFMTTPPDNPVPDPAVGHAAETAADEARRAAEQSLKDGSLDLAGLFSQVDAEDDAGTRTYGHMHIRAALLALPHIGDVKANKILDELGIKHDEHLDVLGSQERQDIINAVQAEQ